jgi:capsular polysaccharide export protein
MYNTANLYLFITIIMTSSFTLWTASSGILKKSYINTLLAGDLVSIKSTKHKPQPGDIAIGWGNKNNTTSAKAFAQQEKLPYLRLEDGFIGYIGHPARNGHEVSLICDDEGIYYDARQSSQLEQLILQPSTDENLERTRDVIRQIKKHSITKYNCYENLDTPPLIDEYFNNIQQPIVLLIDQVAGDLSLQGAMATEQDFAYMVEQARKNHPDARLLIRTHPDTRLGKKKGVLANLKIPNVDIISSPCHPHILINKADFVYTVSSQMGFEALLLDKPVYCFGLPFYAGWGLTQDTKKCERRKNVSLLQLASAALITYPKYYDPIIKKPCEIEDAIELIALQYQQEKKWEKLYLVDFSLWKRAFIQAFCQHLSSNIKFVKKLPTRINDNEQIVVWGAKYPELKNCIRIEDGFIRSKGLGSNLHPPSSLSIDETGIYFNSQNESDLEKLCQNKVFTEAESIRANELLKLMQQSGVSKYNVGDNSSYIPPKTDKPIILVIGQVDGDASLLMGSPFVKSNEELLWAVHEEIPDAFIIYKPHPDVVSGNRAGTISKRCLEQCIQKQVINNSLISLFPHVNEIHTMTSLSGFEALIQGVKVVTWGQPFYAGWGVTKDMNPVLRRTNKLPLAHLVYLTIISYPRYIDRITGLQSTPERLIYQLSQVKNNTILEITTWQRLKVKAKALFNTFL